MCVCAPKHATALIAPRTRNVIRDGDGESDEEVNMGIVARDIAEMSERAV